MPNSGSLDRTCRFYHELALRWSHRLNVAIRGWLFHDKITVDQLNFGHISRKFGPNSLLRCELGAAFCFRILSCNRAAVHVAPICFRCQVFQNACKHGPPTRHRPLRCTFDCVAHAGCDQRVQQGGCLRPTTAERTGLSRVLRTSRTPSIAASTSCLTALVTPRTRPLAQAVRAGCATATLGPGPPCSAMHHDRARLCLRLRSSSTAAAADSER